MWTSWIKLLQGKYISAMEIKLHIQRPDENMQQCLWGCWINLSLPPLPHKKDVASYAECTFHDKPLPAFFCCADQNNQLCLKIKPIWDERVWEMFMLLWISFTQVYHNGFALCVMWNINIVIRYLQIIYMALMSYSSKSMVYLEIKITTIYI